MLLSMDLSDMLIAFRLQNLPAVLKSVRKMIKMH
jgi:hypothetical protein